MDDKIDICKIWLHNNIKIRKKQPKVNKRAAINIHNTKQGTNWRNPNNVSQ